MVWYNNGFRVFYCDGRLCIWRVTSFARYSLRCCHSGWIFDLRQGTVHQAPNIEQRWDCGSKQSRFVWEVVGLCSGPVDGHQLYCPKGEWVTYYTGGVECSGSGSYCIWTLVAQTGSPDISTESGAAGTDSDEESATASTQPKGPTLADLAFMLWKTKSLGVDIGVSDRRFDPVEHLPFDANHTMLRDMVDFELYIPDESTFKLRGGRELYDSRITLFLHSSEITLSREFLVCCCITSPFY